MLFSELEEVLEDLSRNKQRLTVSRHAYNIPVSYTHLTLPTT